MQRGRDGRTTVRWRTVHKRNEPLDCRTYSYGALVTLFDEAKRMRSSEDPEVQFGWVQFWDEVEARAKQT